MADELDPQQTARDELADNMVPTPDDLLDNIGPFGLMWYLEQLAYYVMNQWTAFLVAAAKDDVPDGSEPVQALAAIADAVGHIDGALVLLKMLPDEAVSHGTTSLPATDALQAIDRLTAAQRTR